MLFPNWRSKKDPSKIPALVFDFGSTGVKILRCNYLPEKVEILDGRKVAYPEGTVSGDEFSHPERILPPLQEAVAALTDPAGKDQVYSAVVGLGGLSVSGFTSQINYRRANTEHTIANGEFTSILKKVEDRADQIMRKLIAWETAEAPTAQLISSEVLDLTLDGYSVASPVGSSGQRLSFTVYNSYTKSANFKAVTNLMANLKLDLVSVSPTMYAQLRLLLESFDPNLSAVLLDVGGKTTELGLLVAGRIIGHLGFDVAGESFSRSLADRFENDFGQGEAAKLAFAAGKLPADAAAEVREVLASDCKVFLSGVELLLKEFPGISRSFEQFYFSGGGALLPGLAAAVEKAESALPGAAGVAKRAVMLVPKDVAGVYDLSGRLNSPADLPALATALDAADLVRA